MKLANIQLDMPYKFLFMMLQLAFRNKGNMVYPHHGEILSQILKSIYKIVFYNFHNIDISIIFKV